MNVHVKLKGMGFRKTEICKPEYQSKLGYSTMVPDDKIWTYDKNGRGQNSIVKDKVHPKGDSFYVLRYKDSYTIWVLVKNFDINTIWLDNPNYTYSEYNSKSVYGFSNRKDRLSSIYSISDSKSFRIESKTDILNLLPKEVKRDFILNQLLK